MRSSTMRSGSNGFLARCSQSTNATSRTTARTRKVTGRRAPQPCTEVSFGFAGCFGLGGLGEAVDQRDEAGGRQQHAGDVVAGVAVAPCSRAPAGRRERGGDQRDRHVDAEAPAPRGVLGQDAADDQADRRAAAGDRAEHAERLGALLRLGERHRDEGQRRRRHQRGEGALQGAGGEQQLLRSGRGRRAPTRRRSRAGR